MEFPSEITVILILTWIMYRVMSMLDTQKKEYYLFFFWEVLSIYNEVDIFWSNNSLT